MSLFKAPTCEIGLAQFKEFAPEIVDIIEDKIFNHYSWNSQNTLNMRMLFGSIFKTINQYGDDFKIFTTNYDRAVENFCSSMVQDLLFIDGFKLDPVSQRYIWNSRNFEDIDTHIQKQHVYLYKLHGSLDWKEDAYYGFIRLTGHEKRVTND